MTRRAWLCVTMLCVLFFAEAPANAAGTKIGFVDIQRVLVRSVAGIAAREQLEKERGGMQKDIQSRQSELEKLREELEKKGPLLSADARKEKQETLERKVRDFRRLTDDFQKDLENKNAGLTQKILQDVQGVVERYGKQKGYLLLLVVEKRGGSVSNPFVIYGDPEADVTDEIIKIYDQEHAKAKK